MVVSILEANSAQTAGLYLPVSRLRPRRELIDRVGVDFCREHSVLPLWEQSGSVLVATTHTRDQDMLRELRQRLGQPVTLRISGRGEIRLALDSATGQPTQADWRRALADVLHALQVMRSEQVATYAFGAEDEPYLGSSLVEAHMISEDERLEAVGLAFHLPSINMDEHLPIAGLDALLPAELLTKLRALPLWSIRDEVFIAVDQPPTVELLDRLDQVLGVAIRPVLVQPEQLTKRLQSLPTDGPLSAGDIGEGLTRAGVASRTQVEAAARIAMQTGEPLERAIARVAGLSEETIRTALARAVSAPPLADLEVQGPAVRTLSERLCRRLGAAVVEIDDERATVALRNPWDQRVRRGLAALLARDIRLVYVTESELRDILAAHGGTRRPDILRTGDPLRTIRLLTAAGFISAESASRVDVDLERAEPSDLERLWTLLANGKRSEAVALDVALPRVQHLLLRPDPRAARLRPTGEGALPLLPLLQEDDVLTVAIASPDQMENARRLANRHQLSVRLAVTREEDIDAARLDLATLDFSALTEPYIAFGRMLEQEYGVRRIRVLGLFRRMQETGESLDLAAQRLEILPPEDTRDAFARYLNTEAVHLTRKERLDTRVINGVSATRRVLDDPVDHDLARLLPLEDSQQTGAVPLRRIDGRLVLAMADPLDHRSVLRLQDVLREPFYVQPATRNDIREAAQRAHGKSTVGDLLLEADLITREDLHRALELAARTGVRLGVAVLSLGLVSEEQLGEQIAFQQGMPFVAIRGLDLDPAIASVLPEHLARTREVIALDRDPEGVVTVAVADPTDKTALEEVKAALDGAVSFVATTRTDVRDALERLYHDQYLEHSATDLRNRAPAESAYMVLSKGQKRFFIGFAATLVALLALLPIPTLTVMMALSTGFYLAFSSYKFYLIYRALSHTLEVPVSGEEVEELEERMLPVYTILVPLYKEAQILPALVAGLSRLDYPLEKLDVKLLLEEDDVDTIRAARAARLPSFFDITIVPHGEPKGKPKACNYGLLHARGQYVVIFDAEDIPEPDQLKKVLVAFRKSADHVVCVQAKLNYFNRNQNALTKWFTTEYSTWFDLFLPGLDASGAPIPLGGTSNHFRTEALKLVGGWDPFNVTEDADLGLRIFKLGGATVVVDSTTYEEANSVVDNWIRQRSRWVKGYIQTYLVHMRHPMRLYQQLGPNGFFSFQLVIGGTFFGFLLNPLLWGLTGVWFITEWGVIQQIFPAPIYYMGATSLYVGNFAFAYMNVAGCLRRRYYSLVKWALLSPVYWVLMSIAAWKGFLQLFYRPFYWEKTVHGLTNVSGLEAAGILQESSH